MCRISRDKFIVLKSFVCFEREVGLGGVGTMIYEVFLYKTNGFMS